MLDSIGSLESQVSQTNALKDLPHQTSNCDWTTTRELARFTRQPELVLLQRKQQFVLDLPGSLLSDETLNQIGRLRAQAFSAMGEGGNNAVDLDQHDRYYHHLIVWSEENKNILGAYRYASINQQGAVSGGPLYTASLFNYGDEFFSNIGPALEIGRAFVPPQFQRSVEPLFLLWQGIGRVVAKSPEHRFLFGAVSISKTYPEELRAMILQELVGLREQCPQARMLALPVSAKNPAAFVSDRSLSGLISTDRTMSMSEIDHRIRSLDPEGRGVPVLFKRYLELGGSFVAFHDDLGFGSIACLAVLDLLKVSPRALSKFMGESGATAFRTRYLSSTCGS